ncbi:30S ribosomal protein S1, chloroplastic [Tetrabaena socialis]|uniref:30S ribosomal protein S1, chloroplastic n=1 Tax=Tetrabaena socialis TaxID=47790 RepID=A0A2J7ZWK0_9CHLO|nr:30S ribosomal protein S1, chloroplastic [Tetrabaena socialis]|eukprot:PNH04632.1 30S ribosomal protein S1, chloroplastic [Tetrabaena socialis]
MAKMQAYCNSTGCRHAQLVNFFTEGALPPQAGDLVSGVVQSVGPLGVYVLLGSGPRGLLLIDHISQERVRLAKRLGGMFKEGDKVTALVTRLARMQHPGSGSVELSTKKLERTPGDMLRNPQLVYDTAEETAERIRAATPKAGDLVAGVVTAIRSYGAFLDLGSGHDGLLHKGQISQEPIGDARAVLKMGDTVKALVLDSRGGLTFDLSTQELEPTPGDMLRNPQLVYDRAEAMAVQYRQRQ